MAGANIGHHAHVHGFSCCHCLPLGRSQHRFPPANDDPATFLWSDINCLWGGSSPVLHCAGPVRVVYGSVIARPFHSPLSHSRTRVTSQWRADRDGRRNGASNTGALGWEGAPMQGMAVRRVRRI